MVARSIFSSVKLQEKLDAFTKTLIASGQIPPDVVAQLLDGIKAHVASGVADRALKAGDVAPRFALQDAEGSPLRSTELLAQGPLVVSFYRGVWCPYCNLELQALEGSRAEIESRGASLVAISMQNAAHSRKSTRDNKLGFPILVDAGGTVTAEFGLRYALSADMIALNKKLGTDLTHINGESSWTLPMPGRYLIAQDGIIEYAEVNADYTHRPDPSELYSILDRLAGPTAA